MTENDKTKRAMFPTFRRIFALFGACLSSRKFRRRMIIGLLIAGALLWWNIFRGKKLRISPETTILTEPLTPDGKRVDYMAYLKTQYPPEMKTDKNIARVLFRDLDMTMEMSKDPYETRECAEKREKCFREFCADLGLDPSLARKFHYETVDDQFRRELDAELPDTPENAQERKKRKEEFDSYWILFPKFLERYGDLIRRWEGNNRQALDLIANAAENGTVCRFPFLPPEDEMPLGFLMPLVQNGREFGRMLILRSAYRAQNGDAAGAVRDAAACKKIGILMTKDSCCMVDSLVGIALASLGNGVPIGINSAAPPSREAWEQLLAGPGVQIEEKDFQTAFDSEFILGIGTAAWFGFRNNAGDIINICEGKGPDFPSCGLLQIFGFDWNRVLARQYEIQFQINKEAKKGYVGFKTKQRLLGGTSDEKYLQKIALSWTLKQRSDRLGELMVSLVAPALDAAHEAFWRCGCNEKLHKINAALRLYHCDHGTLPPAFSIDKDGRPLHSWRVLILPYLGGEARTLYDKIHLDEPWDSDFNRQFHDAAPEIFQCDSRMVDYGENKPVFPKLGPGETCYTVVVGPETLFDGSGTGLDPYTLAKADPTRDAMRMITVTERSDPVNWMRPDAEVTLERARLGVKDRNDAAVQGERTLACSHPGILNAVFFAGNVVAISYSTSWEGDGDGNRRSLRSMLTGRGSELAFD